MTHQEIEANEIVERYVLHQLGPDDRRSFQDHYFGCDECFTRAQVEARFVAGVRSVSRAGVLAVDQPHAQRQSFAGGIFGWAIPALALILLVTLGLSAFWAISLRRENQRLAVAQAEERNRELDRLQHLEAKLRELESSDRALREQKESLTKEIEQLKAKLPDTERGRDDRLGRVNQSDINVPVINIYPAGNPQRGTGTSEVNRVQVPSDVGRIVLILGDYKPGYSAYRLEIRNAAGRLVTTRARLKQDQNGDLSVKLSRTLLSPGKYQLKLYGAQQAIAEYWILVE
jgi:hypothetical protein